MNNLESLAVACCLLVSAQALAQTAPRLVGASALEGVEPLSC